MLNWNLEQLVALPKNYKVYVSPKWRHDKLKRKLYRLRTLGYFRQLGYNTFEKTDKEGNPFKRNKLNKQLNLY